MKFRGRTQWTGPDGRQMGATITIVPVHDNHEGGSTT